MSTTRSIKINHLNSQLKKYQSTKPELRNEHEPSSDKGQRLDGESSLREVRQRQSVQYVQESLKFNEKQKEKFRKKQAENWERYSHVNVGQKLSNLNPSDGEKKLIRKKQQLVYELSSTECLKLDQENNSNLNESKSNKTANDNISREKEELHQKQMREVRERMQKSYNENKHNLLG